MEIKTKQDLKNLQQKAVDEDYLSQSILASLYDEGVFGLVDQNYELAFYWYKKASENGDLDSKVRIADYYSDGIGCQKDVERAKSIYLTCIEAGSSSAANNLAVLYRDLGEYEMAFRYYNVAQKLDSQTYGFDVFRIEVGKYYYWGIGVKKDISKAINIFENVIENANVNSEYDVDDANYYLGLCSLNNNNWEHARKYLQLANIDGDNTAAQQLLLLLRR